MLHVELKGSAAKNSVEYGLAKDFRAEIERFVSSFKLIKVLMRSTLNFISSFTYKRCHKPAISVEMDGNQAPCKVAIGAESFENLAFVQAVNTIYIIISRVGSIYVYNQAKKR